MAKNLLCRFALILCLCFTFIGNVWSWDNERTHKDISRIAGEQSVLSKSRGDFLRNLDFSKELLEEFSLNGIRRTVRDWLQEGAKLEDAGSNIDALKGKARFNNHFHNPLKDWDAAGLNDSITLSMPFPPYKITKYLMGESALKWAQDRANQQSYSESKGLEGDQTWQTIRDYYYKALTSKTDSERQAYFARSFKGLGHQMHLIQDMAVPAHVRNDAHPEDALLGKKYYITGDMHFETWAKKNPPIINSFAANPVMPDIDLTKKAPGLAPITQFYDTDQYTQSFVPSTSLTWGLSEYTNANFVSDDTIFSEQFNKDDRHYFPYPRYTGYTQCYEQYEEPYLLTNKMRKYWRKKAGGCAGEAVNHFVQVEPWFKYAPTWDLQRWAIYLDEATHKDYAEKIVPRAVGYSAGLLNYFFRGDIRLSYETSSTPGYVITNYTGEKMEGDFTIYYDNVNDNRFALWAGKGTLEATKGDKTNTFDFIPPSDAKEPGKYIVVFKGKMGNEDGAVAGYVLTRRFEITPPDQFVYSMIHGDTNPMQLTDIQAKVKNTSVEVFGNGTLQAMVKYKKTLGDPQFSHAVSAPIAVAALLETKVKFDFSGSPIPVDATDLYLQVIFKGKIGTEDGAVAIGIKDISEPTPIDVFNDTDKSCVNGSWYSTSEAIDLMDTSIPKDRIADIWDVNPHILQDIYVKISSTENPQNASPAVYDAVVPFLYPGEFKRVMYILTDYNFKYSFYETWTPAPGYTDLWSHGDKVHTLTGTAVKNQTDYTSDPTVCGKDPLCYYYYHPVYYSLRGHDMWWGGGIVFVNWPYPYDSSCQGY